MSHGARHSACPPPDISGPQPGQVWQHYKGDFYRVLHLTQDTEERVRHAGGSDPMSRVVYQLADGTGRMWDRPARMWQEEVELHSYHSAELDQGVQKPTTRRFIRRDDVAETLQRIETDVNALLEAQFIGSGSKTDWDAVARGVTGHAEATGSAVPDEDDPTLMHVTLSFPCTQVNLELTGAPHDGR